MPYGIAGRMPTSLVSARLDRTKMGYIILNTLYSNVRVVSGMIFTLLLELFPSCIT